MDQHLTGVVVVFDRRILPTLTPGRGVRWYVKLLNRTSPGPGRQYIRSANETIGAMVEVISAEVIDHRPDCA
jgi:hypothetical protein